MLISLVIFIMTKKGLPSPAKRLWKTSHTLPEEKAAMSKEIKQRMGALFAVLGIAVFFWFSFHQNGTSMSLFARDFTDTLQSLEMAGHEPVLRDRAHSGDHHVLLCPLAKERDFNSLKRLPSAWGSQA